MPQLCTSRAGCNPDLAFAHLRRQGDAGGEDQALAGISGGGRGARRARARERPWPTDGHARAFSALGDRREADGVGVVNVAAPRPEFVRIRNHAPAAATQREGAAEPPGGAHIRVRRLLNARGGPSGRRSRAPRAAPLRRRTTRRAIPKGSWSFTTGASGADKLPWPQGGSSARLATDAAGALAVRGRRSLHPNSPRAPGLPRSAPPPRRRRGHERSRLRPPSTHESYAIDLAPETRTNLDNSSAHILTYSAQNSYAYFLSARTSRIYSSARLRRLRQAVLRHLAIATRSG